MAKGGEGLKLDLREILVSDGSRLPFERELDAERLSFPSVEGYLGPVTGRGEVLNTAGVLTARGSVEARMRCVCDRCGREFETGRRTDFETPLLPETEGAADDGEAFFLEGDTLDIDELLETAFILDMPAKFLCRSDCRGLCPRCGKDLNEGDCGCKPETDPRFAVLEQLLDK